MVGASKNSDAQEAQQLHIEVQLCREMGWTREQLYEQDDDFIWAVLTVMGAEGEKMRRDNRRNNPQTRVHHEL